MRRATLVALGALTLLTACSSLPGGDDHGADDAQAERTGSVHDEAVDAEAPAEAPDLDDGAADDRQASDADPLPTSATLGRRVIRTAEIELAADDPAETVDEVMRIGERSGGFVATTDLRTDEDSVVRGTITLRVPAAALMDVRRELEGLVDTVPVSRIDEQDVTTETSDLQARVTNLTSYEEELRALLADVRETTDSPDDLLRIFERIREVRAEIDTVEGRLASLSDQVELATVTVRVEPAARALPVSDPTWAPMETAREALSAAATGLSRIVDGVIWITVGVLPVLAVVALPALALLLAWRRVRRETSATTAPVDAPDPGAAG